MDARFPVRARLRTPAHYSRVFKQGRRTGDRYFGLITLPNADDESRMGVVVAKRNVRFAVNRNRIKRIVRQSFRQMRLQLPALDIVVMARGAASSADNQQLFDSLNQHWSKLLETAPPSKPSSDA